MFFPLLSAPGAPELTLSSITDDSLTISWTVPSGTVVERYELIWSVEGSQQPIVIRDTVSSSTHTYTIPRLGVYENATIAIRVTAVNAVGSNSSSLLTVHSDIVQSGPRDEESINIAAIIGGAVGIFHFGIGLGIASAIVITLRYQNRQKHNR